MQEKTSSGMTAQVYDLLLDRIQSCEYLPGAPLQEKGIIAETGFGRTPVREALLALQRDGLVEIFPRKGMRVAQFTQRSVNDLYQVRKLVEPVVLSTYLTLYPKDRLLDYSRRFRESSLEDITAHYELDLDFHGFLVSVTGNEILIGMHHSLLRQVYRLAMYAVVLGTSEPEQNTPEHLAIIDALLRENAQEAKDALVFHLNHSLVSSLRSIEESRPQREQH